MTTLADGRSADVRTDTMRWQVLNSGRPPARAKGATLPASNPLPSLVGTRDLAPGGSDLARTTRFYEGLDGTRAGSTGADPFAPSWRGAGAGPASLVDGDSRTAWISGDGAPMQRVTLDLSAPVRADAVLVHEAWGGDLARLESVSIDGREGVRREGTTTWRVPLDGSRREQITLELHRSPQADAEAPVGVREVELEDGPDLGTGLVVPEGDGAVLLTRDPRGARDPSAGEDPDDLVRRVGPLPPVRVAARVRIRAGAESQDLVATPWSLAGSTAPSETRGAGDLTAWPVAALDGDPTTAWAPSPGVAEPVLDIDLGADRRVEHIRLERAVGPVTVGTDRDRYALAGGTDLRIPAQTTRHLRLTFTRPPGHAHWSAPDVNLPGISGPGERVTLACGDAGAVGRDDGRVGVALDVERSRLIAGETVPARVCGDLPSGDGDIRAVAAPGLLPQAVALTPRSWQPTPVAEGRQVASEREHAGRWLVDVAAGGPSVLVLSQGANPGWRATDESGAQLESMTVDGWRQAFVLPGGEATSVRIDFAPNGDHRRALAAGALAVAVLGLWGLLEMAWHRRRRVGVGLEEAGGTDAPAAEPGPPPAPAARRGGAPLVVAVLAAATVGLLVGGWLGLAAAALGVLVPARRRPGAIIIVLTLAGVSLAVLGVAERQSAGAWVSQGLGSLTLGLLVAALVRPGGGGRGRGPGAPQASTTGAPDPR